MILQIPLGRFRLILSAFAEFLVRPRKRVPYDLANDHLVDVPAAVPMGEEHYQQVFELWVAESAQEHVRSHSLVKEQGRAIDYSPESLSPANVRLSHALMKQMRATEAALSAETEALRKSVLTPEEKRRIAEITAPDYWMTIREDMDAENHHAGRHAPSTQSVLWQECCDACDAFLQLPAAREDELIESIRGAGWAADRVGGWLFCPEHVDWLADVNRLLPPGETDLQRARRDWPAIKAWWNTHGYPPAVDEVAPKALP
jgi:hypothetical protein